MVIKKAIATMLDTDILTVIAVLPFANEVEAAGNDTFRAKPQCWLEPLGIDTDSDAMKVTAALFDRAAAFGTLIHHFVNADLNLKEINK